MDYLEPPFYICIDNWRKLPELHTTGTRDKSVFIGPSKKTYYFKTSIKQDKKDYPFEFWSEIIASRLGFLLRLPVLNYNIASYRDKIGCISENMINRNEEELIEGVILILQFEPNFREICKTSHYLWKIERALKSVGLGEFKRIAIEMVLFDCIIGNTDRHSENWALIRNKVGQSFYSKLKKQNIFRRYFSYYRIHKDFDIPYLKIFKLLAIIRHRFAPFYDNGSSLGRELSEEKIIQLLNDDNSFDKFFCNGKSDIIVDEEKKSFLETIDFLLFHYPSECSHFIRKHLSLYNREEWESIVERIDFRYPDKNFETSRISNNRKRFIVKLVDERINYIQSRIPDNGKEI